MCMTHDGRGVSKLQRQAANPLRLRVLLCKMQITSLPDTIASLTALRELDLVTADEDVPELSLPNNMGALTVGTCWLPVPTR